MKRKKTSAVLNYSLLLSMQVWGNFEDFNDTVQVIQSGKTGTGDI